MSTGLARDQVAGNAASKVAIVAGDNSAMMPPVSSHASVASTPKPPPLVRIANRSHRRGLIARDSVSAAENRSPNPLTRNNPARRNAASYTASDPASAPVWERAAAEAAGWRPDFTTITGLPRAAARAALMNFRADVT